MDITKFNRYVFAFIIASCMYSCSANKQAVNSDMVDIDLIDEEKLTWGKRDTSSQNKAFDGSGEGIFGRKIVYRNLSGLAFKNIEAGKISMMVCINKEGSIYYAAILKSETTISDKNSLIKYLKAGSEYKFQPDMNAPNEQCGKMILVINEKKILSNSNFSDGLEINEQTMTWGYRDTTMSSFDGSGNGVFGRKIIYRDLSATKAAVNVSGKVVIQVCINRTGLVTYVKLLDSETTITDKTILKRYLAAAKGYKFQPDMNAPNEQCGKMKFSISTTVKNSNF